MPMNFRSRWLFATALCGQLMLGALPVVAGESQTATVAGHPSDHRASLDVTLSRLAPLANPRVMHLAARAISCAAPDAERLAVIDFSLPSSKPRLWVFDLENEELLFKELVSHGQGSGNATANAFSNVPDSHQSSIGLFRTLNSYYGRNGYSLRLEGMESGVNDLAYQRAIVIHGADYVSESFIEKTGRLGRSHGCPAVRQEIAGALIDSLKENQYLFTYYPDSEWLANSEFLRCDRNDSQLALN